MKMEVARVLKMEDVLKGSRRGGILRREGVDIGEGGGGGGVCKDEILVLLII